jgi:hypothetical protein
VHGYQGLVMSVAILAAGGSGPPSRSAVQVIVPG